MCTDELILIISRSRLSQIRDFSLNLLDFFVHRLFAQTFNVFLPLFDDFLKFIPELFVLLFLSNLDEAHILQDLVQLLTYVRILGQCIFLNLEQVLFVGFAMQCICYALLVCFQIDEILLL